jgi:MFS family permease
MGMTQSQTSVVDVARRASDGEPRVRPALTGAGLATILLGYGLPVFNFFAVTVTLGPLGVDLAASPAVLELVIAAFGAAYASLVVLGGRIGDRLGRRRVFTIGLVVLGAFSVLCALAPTIAVLISGRVGQGIGAALVAPQVLALIQSSTRGQARARALGWFGAMAGLASCAAFVIGGVLVQMSPGNSGWRSVFWFDVVVAVAALTAVRTVPEVRGSSGGRLDLTGTALLATAVTLVIVPLTLGRALGWPWWTWAVLAAAGLVGGGFWAWQRRMDRHGRDPLLPPRVLRNRSLAVGLVVTAAYSLVFAGFMFVFSYAASAAAGLGPVLVGAALVPFALAFLATSLATPRWRGPTPTHMRLGAVAAAVSLLALALTGLVVWPPIGWASVLPLAMLGAAQGCLLVPLFGTVLSGVPAEQAGIGGGALLTTMQLSMAIGSALVGSVYLELGGAPSHGAWVAVLSGSVGTLLVVAWLIGRLPRR